jgi:cysteine sulfinate desulfinase/cysteine desulfurase-like protein
MANGLLDLNVLKDAIREDTILVSIMHVNNEIGVIQDIEAIGNLCRQLSGHAKQQFFCFLHPSQREQ